MVLHYVLAMYGVSDNSYFNELNAYNDTEKGNWRRRGVGSRSICCTITCNGMQTNIEFCVMASHPYCVYQV